MFAKSSNKNYNIDYMLEKDIIEDKPTIKKLERIGVNDPYLIYTYLSLQKDLNEDEINFYKSKAKRYFEKENNKYKVTVQEIMRNASGKPFGDKGDKAGEP